MTADEPSVPPKRQEGYLKVEIRDVRSIPLPEGNTGEGLAIRTDRGEVTGILHGARHRDLHRTPGSRKGIVWVCGARGGFGGPGAGLYAQLSESLAAQGISSLRLDYRLPNIIAECVMDLIAGVTYFENSAYDPVVVVGHSFGGAVVIAAGAVSRHVAGVVALSPQTYGADMVGLVSPRPLLVVHGKSDTRLPYSCGQQIYDWANQPKQLALYEGAEHRLEECREELAGLLTQWIPAALAAAPAAP